jgi:predicted nucleic acid-binding protein
MIVLADSTAIIHFDSQRLKMQGIISRFGITQMYISRIGYVELLAGASETSKIRVRKVLNSFRLLEFDSNAVKISSTLGMRYRVGTKQSKDFLIACIAISNKIPVLTENVKDFNYQELEVISYNISKSS